jgi:hypothetical protein
MAYSVYLRGVVRQRPCVAIVNLPALSELRSLQPGIQCCRAAASLPERAAGIGSISFGHLEPNQLGVQFRAGFPQQMAWESATQRQPLTLFVGARSVPRSWHSSPHPDLTRVSSRDGPGIHGSGFSRVLFQDNGSSEHRGGKRPHDQERLQVRRSGRQRSVHASIALRASRRFAPLLSGHFAAPLHLDWPQYGNRPARPEARHHLDRAARTGAQARSLAVCCAARERISTLPAWLAASERRSAWTTSP